MCDPTLGVCRAYCESDGDCPNQMCVNGRCARPTSGCLNDQICVSAHCQQGTCCDSACDGECKRCDVPGHIGTCTPVPTPGPGC